MNRRIFTAAAVTSCLGAAPSDRIRIAVMGVRGQGGRVAQSMAGFPDVEIVTLCDADERTYSPIADRIAQRQGGKRPGYQQDIRRVLDDKSIDAVINGTPDHWHAPGTILACNAGKDVYSEKPASHNLREGRLMVEAARKNKRIVQIGTQSRSRPNTREGIALARSGKIGTLRMAKAWDIQLRDDIGRKSDSAIPKGVDFDLWTGPALDLPFNENRFHYNWHWNWNYGTGDMGNDGVHQLDQARWALGVNTPLRVSGMGKKVHFNDDQQTPDTMNITYEFDNNLAIIFEMRIWNPYGSNGIQNGMAIYGTEGMMEIGQRERGKWGYWTYDTKGALVPELTKIDNSPDNQHHRNFLDCVKSRELPNADVEIGHTSTTLCHLGNIVARTGRNLSFDGAKETIVGDSDANKLLTRPYRKHWSVPKGV
jgi:predicted dehydrogenase